MIFFLTDSYYSLAVNPCRDETAPTNWQSECWLYGVFLSSPLLSNVLFIVRRHHASVSHCHCLPHNLCALLAYLYCKVVPVRHVNTLRRERERERETWLTDMTELALPVNISTFTNWSNIWADTDSPKNIWIVFPPRLYLDIFTCFHRGSGGRNLYWSAGHPACG